MTASSGVERVVSKHQLLDIHDLERRVRDSGRGGRASQLDHSDRQVDADDLAIGGDLGGEWLAQSSRTAGQVEHAHPRLQLEKVDHALPAASLSARHDVVEPALIGRRVAAEDGREQLFRFHFHSCSNHAAARSVSLLRRPTTCMPTGRPFAGAGSTATG